VRSLSLINRYFTFGKAISPRCLSFTVLSGLRFFIFKGDFDVTKLVYPLPIVFLWAGGIEPPPKEHFRTVGTSLPYDGTASSPGSRTMH